MAEAYFCSLCNVKIQDKITRDAHFNGKKHQLALHKEFITDQKEKCGVFITGLPNLVSKEQITEFLETFGKTKEIFLGEDNRFALVEFSDYKSAEHLIAMQKVFFMGRQLSVKPRNRKDRASEIKDKPELDYDAINSSLMDIPFDEQVEKLLSELQPNQSHLSQGYYILCRDLHQTLLQVFPDSCSVYPFGSTVTGLNFQHSDVDVFVQINRTEDGEPSCQSCIKKSKKILSKSRLFSQVLTIPKAKTPIAKCVHTPTGISCDFNFKSMLGVCNSYLVKHYLSLSPGIRKAAMIIKYWASIHDLHGTGSKFSNYALIVMLIFYLQQEPISCESVCDMQRNPDWANFQGGWNGGFLPSMVSNERLFGKSILDILREFFEFYSNFNYSLYVICPYLGRIIPKADFLRPDILSSDFDLYKINLVRMPSLLVDSPICIQDPFEHNHNLTKVVGERVAEDFKNYCKHASEILREQQENGPLYKLFTLEPLDTKFMTNKDCCEFSLKMGQSLEYLERKIPEDAIERSEAIKVLWFEMVNEFTIKVLSKILKCDLSIVTNTVPDSKPEGVIDSVTLHCKAMHNVWECRRVIKRDITLKDDTTTLDKEIQMSDYIIDVLCKNTTAVHPIVEFTITLYAREAPLQVDVAIKKVSAMKKCFRSLSVFLATRLPHWLSAHEREMTEGLKKMTE